jgi:diadenosine tetraphosphate (Ap4A) HIT family hydrolase/predicted DNA-binding WGR domain protein
MKKVDPHTRSLKYYCLYVDRYLGGQETVVLTRKWGRIGRDPRFATTEYASEIAALEAFEQMQAKKGQRGYTVVDDAEGIPGWHIEPACPLCKVTGGIDVTDFDSARLVSQRKRTTVLVSYDQRYGGRCMVIFRDHVPDFLGLDGASYLEFVSDIRTVSFAIQKAFNPDALNYAILGNVVRHLHCHIIPRRTTDEDWGRAPLLNTDATMAPSLSLEQYREITVRIRRALPGYEVAESQLTFF